MDQAVNTANQTSAYSYDGDGHRVKRNINGTETWQVYGFGGELIAEYAQNGSAASPQKEYGYRNGQLLVTVTAGSGTPPVFTDNPLTATTTVVKAVHLTELRDAINQARARAGLSAATWTDSSLTGVAIKAVHITELRTKLDEARAALGLSAASYTDSNLSGVTVKAVHITELRARVAEAQSAIDIRWMVTDQLGTPRMVFDQSGNLSGVSRHDYLPFGEELFAGTGGRTTAQGYNASDGVRQHFSKKERDTESGLDYFGARYYASTQGRFTSADPLLSSGTVESPQSWNRYSYVLNNSLILIDPDGLYVFDSSVSDPEREGFRKGLARARNNLWKIAATYGVKSKEFKMAQQALNAYGAEGVKNGVMIKATTDPNAKPGGTQVAGVAGRKTAANPTGQDIRITFRSDLFDNPGLDQTISHEGSHGADGSDWVASGFANSKNPTNYQTEFDAYAVQFLEVQADFNSKGRASTNIGGWHQDPGKAQWVPLILVEWDEGWKEADRATMRAKNINNLLERPRDVRGYDVTPTRQGGPAFRKGSRFR